MEHQFARDFGMVRVHTGSKADAMAVEAAAHGYTLGNDIVLRRGRYRPGTSAGRRLLAHELAHVVQQAGGGYPGLTGLPRPRIQRKPDDEGPAESVAPASTEPAVSPLHEARTTGAGRVYKIVFSCGEMRMRLETATTVYTYGLTECSLEKGTYKPTVKVTGHNFHLDFGADVPKDQEFGFSYEVKPDEENPASLLEDEARVLVEVTDHVPAPVATPKREEERRRRDKPPCAITLKDRELVPRTPLNRDLFRPRTLKPTKIWGHTIPLAQFGWVDVEARVSGSLRGKLTGGFGPGQLTGLCLTHLIEGDPDDEVKSIAGRAHFRLPARAAVGIEAIGKLKIAGDYLSVIEVAAAKAELKAKGSASVRGSIDADVEVIARGRPLAGATSPEGTAGVLIDPRTIESVDLAAEIGLRGSAQLSAAIEGSLGFSIAKFDLWRQSWPVGRFDAGVSWAGAFKYSPNPGPHWDLGTLDKTDDVATESELPLEDIEFHEDEAAVDEQDVLTEVFAEDHSSVDTPEGLSKDDPLPFDWHKTLELYPKVLDIPRAADPTTVHRDDGPTTVRYETRHTDPARRRTLYEDIGVAEDNWPYEGKTFDYIPGSRADREKERMRRLLDRLGYDRSGTDVDHVHELQFGGAEYDRFDNLWPADNSGNRSAGGRHDRQLREYEGRLGSLAGRWFTIARIRI